MRPLSTLAPGHLKRHFNSHTPHGVRLNEKNLIVPSSSDFNSHTPHGVRQPLNTVRDWAKNFNSHTPHGVRPRPRTPHASRKNFNSHTPHGVRRTVLLFSVRQRYFNSHTPHGVRLNVKISSGIVRKISTHTPHTGCDLKRSYVSRIFLLFQLTHPTRGATRRIFFFALLLNGFQLTHPTRGATFPQRGPAQELRISTHTPHTGCDKQQSLKAKRKMNFNSHTPHGVRRKTLLVLPTGCGISTHTPHTGCDLSVCLILTL